VERSLIVADSVALVLIHGGQHDSRCWQPTVDAINREAPGTRILAVNLPGRMGVPGDLDTMVDNLVENALHYTAPDTPIRIEWGFIG